MIYADPCEMRVLEGLWRNQPEARDYFPPECQKAIDDMLNKGWIEEVANWEFKTVKIQITELGIRIQKEAYNNGCRPLS